MGFSEWFSFKSKAEREQEMRAYTRWAFPYGEAQRERITDLLAELIPEESTKTALAVFLMGREGYKGSVKEDPFELESRTEERKLERTVYLLQPHLPGRHKKLMSRYIALIQADSMIGEDLNYPDVKMLRAKAEELDVLLQQYRY